MDLEIKGIKGVQQCWVNTVKKDIVLPDGRIISPFDANKDDYEEALKKHNNLRYLIDTNGKNLIDVLTLPNVDTYNTVSNDVWEIYQLYGIEAARKCIVSEINQLLEYNETYIQERHVSLLVDVMTNQGTLVSVDRHGVNKTDSGPLHRASFEETTTQITNASIFNEVDLMTGVSGNIMFGQFIPTGTNAFKISLDIEKIKQQTPAKQDIIVPQRREVIRKPVETLDLTDLCADVNFEFTFKLNTEVDVPK
jgi:DNA-directed RNA polymerase II subunit RPB1